MADLLYLSQYFTTTLSVVGGIDASQTTGIVFQDITGIDTPAKPGLFLLNYSDPLNESICEWATYSYVNTTTKEAHGVVRGAEKGAAKAHDNGVTVAFPISESHINRINDKLTGVDPIVAPSLSGTVTGTYTLGGTPTIQGPLTVSPIFYGSIDGWIYSNDTWTYASANTINVPTGAGNRYQVGDKIKWTQTTTKYGVITAVSDTLLTIAVNTDYVVTNAAISYNMYSHQANPLGFPEKFNFTVVAAGFSTPPTGMLGCYSTVGRMATVSVAMPNTGTSNTTGLSVTSPITCATVAAGISYTAQVLGGNDNGGYQTNIVSGINQASATITYNLNAGAAAWTASGAKNASYVSITYPF